MKFFPLVKEDVQWDLLWCEITNHMAQYREYAGEKPIEPVSYVTSEESLLGHLFTKAFCLGCNVLTDRLRESLRHIDNYPNGIEVIGEVCRAMLRDERNHRELAAALWRQREKVATGRCGANVLSGIG